MSVDTESSSLLRESHYHLERGSLGSIGSIVEPVSRGGTIVLVTTPPVERLFAGRVLKSFRRPVTTVLMDDGEATKNLETAEGIVSAMLEAGARRDCLVIALGGGVVGDTAGFAASIFMRGVDLVHVPTTLLAQVDSSIGGKVAVNHAQGKNLIGSFHQPKLVIADPEVLVTLPRREILSGLFEILKAGVIGDPILFDLVASCSGGIMNCDPGVLTEAIRRSVALKIRITSKDEKESGDRRLLNYGHTIGHGFEAALDYQGLSHGEAVAWGMIAANAIARRRGLLDEETHTRIDDAIHAYEPAPIPRFDRETLNAAVDHDKKFTAGRRVMVLPTAIGSCTIVDDVSEDEIRFGVESATSRSAFR